MSVWAIAFLGITSMVATLRAGTVRNYRRSGDNPVIFVLRRLSWLYCGIWHGLRQREGCSIPESGPALVISNHVTCIDPFLLQQSCRKRVISFLMAREFYELPGLGWLFRAIEAIPVNRTGQDIGSTKAALRALREGKVIGIFPEGHIRLPNEAELVEIKAGAAMLALRGNVPVVPAYIARSRSIPNIVKGIISPVRTAVFYGPPIELERFRSAGRLDRATLDEVSGLFQAALLDLARRAREKRGLRRDGSRSELVKDRGQRAGGTPAPRVGQASRLSRSRAGGTPALPAEDADSGDFRPPLASLPDQDRDSGDFRPPLAKTPAEAADSGDFRPPLAPRAAGGMPAPQTRLSRCP